MRFVLGAEIDHVFILGAGASVDYGLPTWDKLSVLILEKINKSGETSLKYKKEVLAWMSKIGEDKEYYTIDQCITKESRSKEYSSNGLTIEDNIFSIMRSIFEELHKEFEDGWVNKLNQKILDNYGLEGRIAFINYNYDKVLDENLLHFEYLTQKEREIDYRNRIKILSLRYIPAFYPHGNFFSKDQMSRSTHLLRHINTKKSDLDNVIDAVSCYESGDHSVEKYSRNPIKVYLLGLGNGLKINLSNINFENEISEVHVTIKDPSIKKEEIIAFLREKFNIFDSKIKVYSTCDDLIEMCFSSINQMWLSNP